MELTGRTKTGEQAAKALLERRTVDLGNTRVIREPFELEQGYTLELYGNRIAHLSDLGRLRIMDAGWPTATTQDRLNALPGVSVRRKAGDFFIDGEWWNGMARIVGRDL